jgi:hypothetical protein
MTRRGGDGAMGRVQGGGDKGKGRQGEGATRRRGDKAKGRQGEGATRRTRNLKPETRNPSNPSNPSTHRKKPQSKSPF